MSQKRLPDDLVAAIAANGKQPAATQEAVAETTTETTTDAVETAVEESAATTTTETAAATTTEATAESATEETDDEGEGYLNQYFPAPVAETTANTTSTEATTTTAETAAPDPKAEALAKALADPKTLWILEQYNKGLDPIAELQKISANDPSKYKSIDLYKMQIEEMKAGEDWTEDQIEGFVEDFQSKNPIEQANLVAAYREKLNTEYKSARESLRPTFNAEEAVRQQQEQMDAINNKALEDLSSWKTNSKGKDFYGLEWTDERIDRVEKFMMTPNAIAITREDGTIDVERSIRINATEMFLRDILKTAITTTKNGTLKAELEKRHNSSPDTVGRQPAGTQKPPMEQWLDANKRT